MTMTAPTYTAEQARAEYAPLLRRAGVIELGGKFGLTEHAVRKLIDGPEAPLKPRALGKATRGYFDREQFLGAIL